MLYTVVKYRVRIVRIIPYRNLGLYTTLIEMTKKYGPLTAFAISQHILSSMNLKAGNPAV